jgi:hypothetical protein
MRSKKPFVLAALSMVAVLCVSAYAADQILLTPQLRIQPERFDIKCPYGAGLTCVISFPEGLGTTHGTQGQIVLENTIQAQSVTVLPNVIMARFDRCEVLPLLKRKVKNVPGTTDILISGTLEKGASFQARGRVRLTSPPRIDVAARPSSIKSGEMVRVMAKSDEKLDTLKVFVKQPGIETRAVAVKMDYDEGSEFPYMYTGIIDTSDLSTGKAMLKIYATDLAGEQTIQTTSLGIR